MVDLATRHTRNPGNYDSGHGRNAARRDVTFTEVVNRLEPESDCEPYEETPLTHVYFLLDREAAQIKIGIAKNIANRQKQHERRRGRQLDLLGSIRGGAALEIAMHSRFAPWRREKHEWYSSEIIGEVAELLAA